MDVFSVQDIRARAEARQRSLERLRESLEQEQQTLDAEQETQNGLSQKVCAFERRLPERGRRSDDGQPSGRLPEGGARLAEPRSKTDQSHRSSGAGLDSSVSLADLDSWEAVQDLEGAEALLDGPPRRLTAPLSPAMRPTASLDRAVPRMQLPPPAPPEDPAAGAGLAPFSPAVEPRIRKLSLLEEIAAVAGGPARPAAFRKPLAGEADAVELYALPRRRAASAPRRVAPEPHALVESPFERAGHFERAGDFEPATGGERKGSSDEERSFEQTADRAAGRATEGAAREGAPILTPSPVGDGAQFCGSAGGVSFSPQASSVRSTSGSPARRLRTPAPESLWRDFLRDLYQSPVYLMRLQDQSQCAFSRWVTAMVVVDFDINEGHRVAAEYPAAALSDSELGRLARAALPDSGAPGVARNGWLALHLHHDSPVSLLHSGLADHRFSLGASVFRSVLDRSNRRGLRQEAVVVVSPLPRSFFYAFLLPFAQFAASACFHFGPAALADLAASLAGWPPPEVAVRGGGGAEPAPDLLCACGSGGGGAGAADVGGVGGNLHPKRPSALRGWLPLHTSSSKKALLFSFTAQCSVAQLSGALASLGPNAPPAARAAVSVVLAAGEAGAVSHARDAGDTLDAPGALDTLDADSTRCMQVPVCSVCRGVGAAPSAKSAPSGQTGVAAAGRAWDARSLRALWALAASAPAPGDGSFSRMQTPALRAKWSQSYSWAFSAGDGEVNGSASDAPPPGSSDAASTAGAARRRRRGRGKGMHEARKTEPKTHERTENLAFSEAVADRDEVDSVLSSVSSLFGPYSPVAMESGDSDGELPTAGTSRLGGLREALRTALEGRARGAATAGAATGMERSGPDFAASGVGGASGLHATVSPASAAGAGGLFVQAEGTVAAVPGFAGEMSNNAGGVFGPAGRRSDFRPPPPPPPLSAAAPRTSCSSASASCNSPRTSCSSSRTSCSSPSIPVGAVLGPLLRDGLLLWELLISGHPIVAMCENPCRCSAAALALPDLIRPLIFQGDFRPYLNSFDPDLEVFRQYMRSASAAAPSSRTPRGAADTLAASATSAIAAALRGAAGAGGGAGGDGAAADAASALPAMILASSNPLMLSLFGDAAAVVVLDSAQALFGVGGSGPGAAGRASCIRTPSGLKLSLAGLRTPPVLKKAANLLRAGGGGGLRPQPSPPRREQRAPAPSAGGFAPRSPPPADPRPWRPEAAAEREAAPRHARGPPAAAASALASSIFAQHAAGGHVPQPGPHSGSLSENWRANFAPGGAPDGDAAVAELAASAKAIKAFYFELTTAFLVPFAPYLRADMRDLMRNPLLSETPRPPLFRGEAFLASVRRASAGASLLKWSAGELTPGSTRKTKVELLPPFSELPTNLVVLLYRRFIRTRTFRVWFSKTLAAQLADCRRLHVAHCAGIENVDALLRRMSLTEAADACGHLKNLARVAEADPAYGPATARKLLATAAQVKSTIGNLFSATAGGGLAFAAMGAAVGGGTVTPPDEAFHSAEDSD